MNFLDVGERGQEKEIHPEGREDGQRVRYWNSALVE